jgi:serine/threonine protein kinase
MLLRLTPAIGRDFAIRGRLLHVWGVLRTLNHPCIARILGIIEESDLSLVLEEFPSGTLDSLLQKGPIPPDQVLAWAQQAAAALAAAHARGVLHRDLHPDNIFLHDGEVRLAGFGIALAVQ